MRKSLLCASALAAGFAAMATAASPKPPDLATARVVDLTHAFDENTIYWPTSPSAFELKPLSYGPTPGGWFYASNAFCTPEHGGTHLDAPIHFAKDGLTADRIPVRQLIAPAAVIDMRAKTAADPDSGALPAALPISLLAGLVAALVVLLIPRLPRRA